MKKNNELFVLEGFRQPHTNSSRKSTINQIINDARYSIRYMYTMREAAGILHISYDEIQTLVYFYKLDAIKIASIVRIPWWSLCEFLIDPADDIDECFAGYAKSLPHKELKIAI